MSGTSEGIGGIESLMPYIMRNLLEMGVDIHLIAQFIPAVYADDIFSGKIHEVSIPGLKSGLYMKIPRFLRYPLYVWYGYNIVKLIKNLHPDVIHCQGTILSLYGLCVKKIYHIPYITTFHSSLRLENYLPFSSMYSIMQRLWKNNPIFKNANALTAVSLSLQKETEMLTNCHISIVSNAVNSTYFSLDRKECYFNKKPILISVSRLSPVKALKDAIEAMLYIIDEIPDCKLLIVGDGEQKDELKEYVSSLGLDNSVVFVGSVLNHDTKEYYHNSKIFLLPSESESFSISLLEAMSCGLPFVATPTGIVPEVHNGCNGVVVPFHCPERIADGVKHLLSLSNEEIYSIAQINHSIASQYSWKKSCEQYLEIYREILNQ